MFVPSMFILMRHEENEVDSCMHMVGTFDSHDEAAKHMLASYERVKTDYETANPFDEWQLAYADDDQAELKVEGMPDRWVWAIFDTERRMSVWF